jgi:hypothetical protein
MKKTVLLLLSTLFGSLTFSNAQLSTDSLVAFYPFDGNVNDVSGKGNNGTINNAFPAPGFDGKPSSAYYFNGTDAFIDLGSNPSISRFQTDFTVMAWVKRETTSMATNTILSNRNGVSTGNVGSVLTILNGAGTSGNLNITISGGTSAKSSATTGAFTGIGEWHHYAFTYKYKGVGNINVGRLYIDGNLMKVDSNMREVLNPVNTKSYLGLDIPSGVVAITRFKGTMDEVMIYKRALTTAEINSYVGVKRNALNFDGVNDFVSLGNTMNDVFAGAGKKFTIEAWIRPESHASAADNGRIFLAKYGNSACTQDARQFSMSFLNDGKLNFVAYGSTGTTDYRGVKGSTTIALNTWNHVVVTYDGSITTSNALDRIKLYVNGTLESSTLPLTSGTYPFNIPTSNAHLGIGSALSTTGAACSQSTQRFDGDIDELRIWNTVRTCTEIISNKDCKLSGTETGLVAYYDFDLGLASGTNTSTNVLIDIAGADQNGALSNFTLTGNTSNWVNAETNGVSSSVCSTVIPSNCNSIVTSDEDESLESETFIFPNPTSDKLFLNVKTANSTYVIFNSMGMELLKGNMAENTINVADLDNGVYHLQLSEKGNNQRLKFIKQ